MHALQSPSECFLVYGNLWTLDSVHALHNIQNAKIQRKSDKMKKKEKQKKDSKKKNGETIEETEQETEDKLKTKKQIKRKRKWYLTEEEAKTQ